MGNHVCHVKNEKTKCWGHNSSGQLGLGDMNSRGDNANEMGNYLPFIDLGKALKAKYVEISTLHTCAHLTNDSLKCWGSNIGGCLGQGDANNRGDNANEMGDYLPNVNLGNGFNLTQVIVGVTYTCALFDNRKVKCFGLNSSGQLGLCDKNNRGDNENEMGDALPFIDFGTSVEVASIHTGAVSSHSCIIIYSTNKMKCWGMNDNFQLGYADTNHRGDEIYEMGENLTEIDLGAVSSVSQIALGQKFTCALRTDSVLNCFGLNANGQLGIGSTTIMTTGTSLLPTNYDSGKEIAKMRAGEAHLCIVYDDYTTLKCIGYNYYGQLGQGDKDDRGKSPTTTLDRIPAIDLGVGSLQISKIVLPNSSTCVMFVNGDVKCFGYNSNGILGHGNSFPIGSISYQMGTNLTFTDVFPTNAPTKSPTSKPTTAEPTTVSPTQSPTPTSKESSTNNNNNSYFGLSIGLGISVPLAAIATAVALYSLQVRKAKSKSNELANTSNIDSL